MAALTTYVYSQLNDTEITNLCSRSNLDFLGSLKKITSIANDVRNKGDQALVEYTKLFDDADLQTLMVPTQTLDSSENAVSDEFKNAIKTAIANVKKFHNKQGQSNYSTETSKGIVCRRKFTPIDSVAIYAPAGLFSTIVMGAVPALQAGCERIVVCSPPNSDGSLAPEVLYTAKTLGIEEVYSIGGAQAIFAMAYGTETIDPVAKIVGPGNQYVTAAKYLVSNTCSIDFLAGPTEAMVIADETSNARFVAADLLSQAEHGSDSQVVLLSTDQKIIDEVQKELEIQAKELARQDQIRATLLKSFVVLCDSVDQVMTFANRYAPEHLIIGVQQPKQYSKKVINAGSVFVGVWSPEAVGDYASGTNHVLPTMGFASSTGGLSVEDFGKYITFQSVSAQGLETLGPDVTVLAKAEDLEAHANSVQVRLDNLK